MFMRKNAIKTAALAALATAAGFGVANAQTSAPTHSTSWTGTVGEDRFGDARFKMRGRFQYDVYSSDWDVGTADDATRTYVRRAFLGVQGRFTERWRYKVDFVLTPSAGEVGVDDAFLEYVADDWSFVIGEHNVTSPLEDRTSSLDIQFAERSSIINTFGYGRAAGLGFIWAGSNYSFAAAVQGDSLNNAESFSEDEPMSVSGRFTFAPIFETTPEGTTLVHLGVHARYRHQGDEADDAADTIFRYRTRPLNGRNSRHIDAGSGLLGETDTTWGAEAAVQYGPFGVQAEYMSLEGDEAGPLGGASFEYDGYYVDAFWSLTGESRNYRGAQGAFGSIVPRNPITQEGGWGHWMLMARYDYIDLSDPAGGSARGEQSAWGVGLDWVPIDHVRFKLNYAVSDMDRTTGTDDEAQIVTLRTQFDF
jgi:phosphate-selective porin OprO/OprP